MTARRKKDFDPNKAKGPRPGPEVGLFTEQQARQAGPTAMSVSALVTHIRDALARAFPERVTVLGELSNVSRPASGHIYFSLKDEQCTIAAAMWKSKAASLKFQPADGLEVIVEGRVDVYDVQGKLQLYVDHITPRGQGALELAFRQMREKLQAEGLFDPAHKKPLVRVPRALGVVTSGTGAAIRDIQRTVRRRWPAARVYLLPTPVQGDSAAAGIAEAITLLDANADRLELDTIIVARGGGSLEDLWAFNEESVARAVFAARTPILSGVGHEVDVSICDLVADVRAATPTAAAELAVPDREDYARAVRQAATQLRRAMTDRLAGARRTLEAVLRSGVFRDPLARVHRSAQRVDELSHRLHAAEDSLLGRAHRRLAPLENRLSAQHPARQADRARATLDRLLSHLGWALGGRAKRDADRLASLETRLAAQHPAAALNLARQQVQAAERQLEALSYRNVLRRGYSVTRGPDGTIRRSAGEFSAGELLHTILADGEIRSRVLPDQDSTPPQPRPSKRIHRKQTRANPPGPTLFE
jgi:exodeoxyribonuclease VII large subunit